MDNERFARLKEIVLTATALPEEVREAWIAKACRDDETLRDEALALLVQPTDRFEALVEHDLDEAVARIGLPKDDRSSGGAAGNAPARSGLGPVVGPGSTFGSYRIESVLGEGGMGVVYRARQIEPIEREVALKIVRGVPSENVLARFETERQSLARMDHPAIARVLDAGSVDRVPYFVMELVDGVPITAFASRESPSTRERVELFLAVCRGVQHAHQKGIVHRDLKPSNVLVSVRDGVALPKIIDFGIAKAIGEGRGETLTEAGQLVGTLEHMSPEQAAGRSAEVDTRSDVYSLGVILYELITGELPYETEGRSLAGLLKAIADEPPRPIRRTGTGSHLRAGDDLETIARKALEKDPDRRYASVGALADDLGRWLASEPIAARPPSTLYQMEKLVARHRVPFAFAGVIVSFLVFFAIAMAFQADAQRRERERAEAEAQKARLVSGFLTELLRSANPDEGGRGEGGRQTTVREILDGAARDLGGELAEQPEVLAQLHLVVGEAYRSLAVFEESRRHLQSSLDLRLQTLGPDHPDVAEARVALASWYMKQDVEAEGMETAEALGRAALESDLARHGPMHESVARDLQLLAMVAEERASYAEAESLLAEVIAIREEVLPPVDARLASALGAIAQPLFYQGKAQEAEDAARRALEIRRTRFGRDHPRVSDSMNDLAFLLHQRGAHAEAESLYLRSIEIWRDVFGDRHADLGQRLSNLGAMYQTLGRLDEAEHTLREAVSVRTDAYGENSHFTAIANNNLGALLDTKGDYAGAEAAYRRVLSVWRGSLGDRHPNVLTTTANLATTLSNRGLYDEAQHLHEDALALRAEVLGERHPQTGLSHLTLGTSHLQAGELDEAERHLETAYGIWTETVGESHLLAAVTRGMIGAVRLGRGDLAQARGHLEAVVPLYEATVGSHVFFAQHLVALGRTRLAQGQLPLAESDLERALAMFDEQVNERHPFAADARLALADLRLEQGRPAEAAALAESAAEAFGLTYPAGHPRIALARVTAAGARALLGEREAARVPDEIVDTALSHASLGPGERERARRRVGSFAGSTR